MTDYYKNSFILDKNFYFILNYDLIKKKLTDYDVSLDDNEMFIGNDSNIRPLNRYSFSTIHDTMVNRILMFGGLLLLKFAFLLFLSFFGSLQSLA
jgi:hypothetical protein